MSSLRKFNDGSNDGMAGAAALRTRARNGRWEHAPPIWRKGFIGQIEQSQALDSFAQTSDPSSPGCCSPGSIKEPGERHLEWATRPTRC